MNAARRLVSMLALVGASAVATVGVTSPVAAGDDEAPAKKQARSPSAVDLALEEGGRVYATATLCDALDSPYRYGRVHDFAPSAEKTDE